jgi:hypothetical protein
MRACCKLVRLRFIFSALGPISFRKNICIASNAQAFSENENFKEISMLMERDILHKHKIENRIIFQFFFSF